MTPHRIAKILQAYNDDECDAFIKVMQEEDDEMGFSSCLGTMALIWACNSSDSMYVAKKKSIHASLLLHTGLKRAMKKALLDTGATENFIHPRVVKQLSLRTKKLTKPQKVKNVDGTLNQSGEITDVVTLIVMYNGKPMWHLFFVTNITSDDLILGYPFFEDVNPSVLWKEGKLKGTLMLATVQKPKEYRDTIPLWLWKATTATQLATEEAAKKKKRMWDEIIPKCYHRYGRVFQEEASKCFPAPWKWNHAINLKEDAPSSIDCRVYPLSPKEKEAQHAFIEENLRLKRIRWSKSPYASGFFFVQKKDGKLWPVQDYCNLNKWTVPNKYPLPLIPDLIHSIAGKMLFMKFDIWWGYNNIPIKPGDEWKAAFKTSEGLFEPMVMFFGLTNSPATF
jgi:Aspartyl protease